MRSSAVFPEGFGFDPSLSAGPAIFSRRSANPRTASSVSVATQRQPTIPAPAALSCDREFKVLPTSNSIFGTGPRLEGDLTHIRQIHDRATTAANFDPVMPRSRHPSDFRGALKRGPSYLPEASVPHQAGQAASPTDDQPQSVMITAALLGIFLAAASYILDFH